MAKQIKITDEVINQWVEALRSGEYSQTRYRMHDKVDGGYCCLGVLLKECFDYSPKYLGSGKYEDSGPVRNLYVTIGSKFCSVGASENLVGDLISHNDDDKYTFEQIANVIEERWRDMKESENV